MIQHKSALLVACFCCLFALSSCSSLPDNTTKQVSHAIQDTNSTFLGRAISEGRQQHPGQSSLLLLSNGLDAFVGRVLLAELAERSIDVQYYTFHQDTVGRLLIDSLVNAAERGVRVRILIDDMYGKEGDDVWTALASHPRIEVRLFNPFIRGASKSLQFLTRLSDVNYRMHNKSFIVDNQATIVGGRNIGDEYFGATPDLAFADLDLMALGPVAPEVSKAFDQYWNSSYAYPATLLSGVAEPGALAELQKSLDILLEDEQAQKYIDALKNSTWAESLRSGNVRFQWARARVIHDSPEKKERKENWKEELLISQLWPYLEETSDEMIIVSPYFVPGEQGADALCDLSRKGVKVVILTNSLASNDVFAVHAGYAQYREQLLEAGVTLYELDEAIKQDVLRRLSWLPGLSKSSLHAKTMVLDRKAMFVGSMNLDLRSLHTNNEIGILFFNDEIAVKSAQEFLRDIDSAAFKVELDESGSLFWKTKKNGEVVIYNDEPYVGFWTKILVWFTSLLPIESFL